MKKILLADGSEVLVDASDYERISERRWYPVYRGHLTYAESSNPDQILLHRFIMGDPSGTVDHINGNTRDNRRSNLRVCTQQENSRNRRIGKNNNSGFKGVSWKADIGKWRARIMVDRKEISLGAFDDKVSAARAYDNAAIEFFGEFARLNFGAAQ